MKTNLIILYLLFYTILHSQEEGNIWYFGNSAGLDFNSGVPVVISGSLNTNEGCSTICDENGNLLFYTNGVTVWNKDHNVMESGTGLLGNYSTNQSSLIVKKPQNESEYFIFTLGAQGSPDGLNWSLVNMGLNNGFGKVVIKNQQLEEGPLSEKLTATLHSNQQDIWVVIHDRSDNFYSYLITPDGLSPSPIITEIGTKHNGPLGFLGSMKFSPSGNKLALSIEYKHIIEIFDFDKSSGIVSNPIKFDDPNEGKFYGLEFSFDESKLYASKLLTEEAIWQFDLSQNTPQEILNSFQLVGTISLTTLNNTGSLQIGPDQKIYFAKRGTGFVDVIHNPNLLGTLCGFEDHAIYLGADTLCHFGLQNINQSIYSLSSTTGIAKININNPVVIYPNPSKDKIKISFENEGQKIEGLKVLNQLGEIVIYDNVKTCLKEYEINLSDLPSGVYYLSIKTELNTIVKTIFKEN